MKFELIRYIDDMKSEINALNLTSHKAPDKNVILAIVREAALMYRMRLLSADELHGIVQEVRKKVDNLVADEEIITALAEILDAPSLVVLSDKFAEEEFLSNISSSPDSPLSNILDNILCKLREHDFSRSLLNILLKDGKNEAFSQTFMSRIITPMLPFIAYDLTVQMSDLTFVPNVGMFFHPKTAKNIKQYTAEFNGKTVASQFDYTASTADTLKFIVKTFYFEQLEFLSHNTHLIPNAMKNTATSLYNMLSKSKRLEVLAEKDPVVVTFNSSETKGAKKHVQVSPLLTNIVGVALNITLLDNATLLFIESITSKNFSEIIVDDIPTKSIQEEFEKLQQFSDPDLLARLEISKQPLQFKGGVKGYLAKQWHVFALVFFSDAELSGKYPIISSYLGQCTLNRYFDEQLQKDLERLIADGLFNKSYLNKLGNPREIIEEHQKYLQTLLKDQPLAKSAYPAIAGFLSDWNKYITKNFASFKQQVHYLKENLVAGPLHLCMEAIKQLEASGEPVSTALNTSKSRSPTIYAPHGGMEAAREESQDPIKSPGKEEEGSEPQEAIKEEQPKKSQKILLIEALKDMAKQYEDSMFRLYAKICVQDLQTLQNEMRENETIPVHLKGGTFLASLSKPVIVDDKLSILKGTVSTLREKLPRYYGYHLDKLLSSIKRNEMSGEEVLADLLTMLPYIRLIKKSDLIKEKIRGLRLILQNKAEEMIRDKDQPPFLYSLLACLTYYSIAINDSAAAENIMTLSLAYNEQSYKKAIEKFSVDPGHFSQMTTGIFKGAFFLPTNIKKLWDKFKNVELKTKESYHL